MTDHDFEQQVRADLREALDRELGPDPTWAESPAAQRVAEVEARRRRRWPLRALAVAALIGATGGAAALLGGGPSEVPPPEAIASPPEASGPPPEALASPLDLSSVTNGWVAFTASQEAPAGDDTDLDIWFVAPDLEPRRVVGTDSDGVDQLCPAFAPDGRTLAYGSVEGAGDNPGDAAWRAGYRNSALVIADVADDGTVSDRQTIAVGDGLPPPCPVWSPDGGQIAFGVPRTSPINPETSAAGSEVWVVTLAGQSITVLPDLLATDLEWSPDGEYLAIASGRDLDGAFGNALQDGQIYLFAASSETVRSLDDTLGVSSLTWSPDSAHIAYADAGGLRVFHIETGQQELLAGPFNTLHGIGPVWSPDGETIAYQRQTSGERHEVVLVTPNARSAQTGLASEVVIPPSQTGGTALFPYRVTWSPDGEYLLYLAWTDGAGDLPGGLIAVPTDQDGPSLLLANPSTIEVYDGYDDTTFVPIQIWGRGPSE